MIHLTKNCLESILVLEGKLKKNSWDDYWQLLTGKVGPWLCGEFTEKTDGYVESDAKKLFLNETFKPFSMEKQEKINCPKCIKSMKEHGLCLSI